MAGHLTIFLTRTRGPFWSIRSARVLWVAVVGTQIVATLIAVYGLFMTPLDWGWALVVWGYVLVWFLVNDRMKLMDSAGKDGAIRHVMSGVNPQGCQVFSFQQPSSEELELEMAYPKTTAKRRSELKSIRSQL